MFARGNGVCHNRLSEISSETLMTPTNLKVGVRLNAKSNSKVGDLNGHLSLGTTGLGLVRELSSRWRFI